MSYVIFPFGKYSRLNPLKILLIVGYDGYKRLWTIHLSSSQYVILQITYIVYTYEIPIHFVIDLLKVLIKQNL